VTLGQGDPVALESLRRRPVVGVVLGAHPALGGRPFDFEVEDVAVVYLLSVGSHVVSALPNLAHEAQRGQARVKSAEVVYDV
jgi:hypothetical protein